MLDENSFNVFAHNVQIIGGPPMEMDQKQVDAVRRLKLLFEEMATEILELRKKQ